MGYQRAWDVLLAILKLAIKPLSPTMLCCPIGMMHWACMRGTGKRTCCGCGVRVNVGSRWRALETESEKRAGFCKARDGPARVLNFCGYVAEGGYWCDEGVVTRIEDE